MLEPQQPTGLVRHLWREQIDLVLIAATVCLFYLSFPSGGYSFLAWIAIVPVLIAIPQATSKQSFYLGFLAALLGWMVSIWWSVDGVANISQSHPSTVLPLIFGLCLICALPYGLTTWLAKKFNLFDTTIGVLKFVALLTLLVNFVPQILPGNLAHSLYLTPELIQLASVGGVPIVFFIVHAVNAFIAFAIIKYRTDKKLSLQALIIACGLFIVNAAIGYSVIALKSAPSDEDGKVVNIGYVQPNFSVLQRTRGDWPEAKFQFSQLIETLENVTKEKAQKLDLVVLPEVPVPISYQNYSSDKREIDRWSKASGILYAGIGFNADIASLKQASQYFNTAEYVKNETLISSYDKQRLLPFAEYLPFEEMLPWLRDIFPNTPKYVKGKQAPIIEVQGTDSTFNVVPLICYEAVFANLVREGTQAGGELLVNVVNDGWFAGEAGYNVHLSLALFRAVEFNKPLLRVTNNGISGLVTTQGVLVEESVIAIDHQGVNNVTVDLNNGATFYANFPYAFALLCFALLFLPIKKASEHV